MSLVSMYLRYSFGKGDKKRDAGLKTPDDVVRYDDISYGKTRKWNLLDVYRPKGKEGKLPLIISVHGGGWVYGTKEVYQYYCMSLAQRGFAVVNFNYRLSPEHKYPAQIEDCNEVMKWVIENKDTYGFDLNNVFALGDSAGGHLLSVYCAMLGDHEYARHYGLEVPEGFSFNAVALNCGVYRQDYPQEKDRSKSLLNDILGKNFTKEEFLMFNSYDKINGTFPPVFLMSCNGDFLREQVDVLEPVLTKYGIPHEVKIYGSDDNVLGHVFHVNMKLEDAKVCNDEECAFFRKYMKG